MSTTVISRNLEDDNYVWDTNTLTWVKMTQPGGGAGGSVTIPTGQGKTLLYAVIDQSSVPGFAVLVNADPTKRINVISYVVVLSAQGQFRFLDDVDAITGNISVAQYSGVSAISDASSPLFQTSIVNSQLRIQTSGGGAAGHLTYFLE